jgi:hypothetical protein
VVQRLIVDVGVADKKVLLEIHLASPPDSYFDAPTTPRRRQ